LSFTFLSCALASRMSDAELEEFFAPDPTAEPQEWEDLFDEYNLGSNGTNETRKTATPTGEPTAEPGDAPAPSYLELLTYEDSLDPTPWPSPEPTGFPSGPTFEPTLDPTADPTLPWHPAAGVKNTWEPTPDPTDEVDLNDLLAEDVDLEQWKPQNCEQQVRTGYLKNIAKKYLTCTNEHCEWDAFSMTAMQMFHQEPVWQEWSMLKAYTPSGAPTGQCLSHYLNQAGEMKIRLASCDIWQSQKWRICNGYLGFGWEMFHCVQSNAGVAKCKDSHTIVKFVQPKCVLASATIDNVKCENPITGGACPAGFQQGTVHGTTSNSDCDACDAAPGSTEQCTYSFTYSTDNTVTQSWSDSFSWKIGASFSITEKFIFGSATQSMSFSFSQTLTSGHAKSFSTTITDTESCAVSLEPGTRESASAQYLEGTIHADFVATVTEHWLCNTGLKKKKAHTDRLKITISNVPTAKVIGSCTIKQQSCKTTAPTHAPTNQLENRLQQALYQAE